MHVDRALLDVDVVAPHLVEQLRAAVHALGMRHEEVQQPELGRARAATRCPLDGDAMRDGVERDGARRERLLRRFRARVRRSTALMRAFSSRGENGLVT